MKTIALVGFADTKVDAPFDNKEIEIWSLNEFGLDLPRCDYLFQIHNLDIIKNNKKDPKHLDKLLKFEGKLFTQKSYKEIPNGKAYPFKKMVGKYGNIFSSTMDYMISYAIESGVGRIELYGMDMALYSEYQRQRPTFMYFIGLAKGKGIDVWIHPKSGLITYERYAMDGDTQLEIEKKLEEIYDTRQYILKCVEEINYTNGMIDAIQLIKEEHDKDDLINKLKTNKQYIVDMVNNLENQKNNQILDLSNISNSNVVITPPDLRLSK